MFTNLIQDIFGPSPTPLGAADRWAIALSSMYSRINRGSDDRLAPFGFLRRQSSWNMLRANWGVDGVTRKRKHEQSRQMLDWLGQVGHRSELADPGDSEAEQDLLAWDTARLVHVARHAFHAGFIDQAEAWSYIRPMAGAAQSRYPSWAEYARRFGRGRLRWLTERDPTIDQAIADLLRDPASPWRTLDWRTPLNWDAEPARDARR